MRRIKLARFLQHLSDLLPRKHPLKSKSGLTEYPFFIFGSGRNGSTMLNRMLNQHTELFLPSEQYFLGNSIIKYKLYNFLNWRDLMKIIAGELFPAAGSHTWDFDADEVFRDLLSMNQRDLVSVIDRIYRTYGNKMKGSCRMWGDTTPLNTYYLPEVFSVFPGGRYIFLIRDGRDVVASYKSAGEEYLGELAKPEKAVIHWQHAIDRYDWLKKRTDVLEVKYEDLVHEPQAQLLRICKFLDVDYQSQLMDFYKKAHDSPMYDEPQHQNLTRAVFTDSIGRWTAVLSESEKNVLNRIYKSLSRFNYL